MNVLLLGSGGRECTLAWKISQSSLLSNLFITPGNGGTLEYGKNLGIAATDFPAIEQFCLENNIQLLVCGPEQPAVAGVWDYFQKDELKHIKVVAPSQKSAMLEGSKAFAKEFMAKNHIPTADYLEITKENISQAYQWFEEKEPPFVIKADGLAEGKGVVLPESKEEAKQLIDEFILKGKFGASSERVVLEEFLDGIEFSIFVYTNGCQYVILPNAKDYKRRFEANKGLNTGGMGCISPVPFVDEALMIQVENTVIKPTISGLMSDQMPYTGFIYFGLILTKNGAKVIEYNCRLGDPETEVIIPRTQCDILALFEAGFSNQLDSFKVEISSQAATTVMLVSDGYPEAYEKGFPITGIENVHQALIFHAGTTIKDYQLITNGGRVLAVTGLGETMQDALAKSYDAIERIRFKGIKFRKDIGFEFYPS
jgi:phosphoribosylamine---glycine ligase